MSFELDLPCHVEVLPELRFDVEAWLVANSADEPTREAFTIVAHELVASAVVGGCKCVNVRGDIVEGEAWLEVRAEAGWGLASASTDGLALKLVYGLMDDVEITTRTQTQTVVRVDRVFCSTDGLERL